MKLRLNVLLIRKCYESSLVKLVSYVSDKYIVSENKWNFTDSVHNINLCTCLCFAQSCQKHLLYKNLRMKLLNTLLKVLQFYLLFVYSNVN